MTVRHLAQNPNGQNFCMSVIEVIDTQSHKTDNEKIEIYEKYTT